MSRLSLILNKLIVKKKTVTLSPTSTAAGTGMITDIPLTKPIVAVYASNRDGWRLLPVKDFRWSETYWTIVSTQEMSGSYDLVIYYMDYEL